MNKELKYNNQKFIIKPDKPEVGCYLLVYNLSGKCVADYLQNSEQEVKEFANEEFGIPLNLWK